MEGSCHCGEVTWQLEAAPEAAKTCNCSICRRYGVLWAYGREGEDIAVSGATKSYSWGDKSLGFHFCLACGCVAFWRSLEADSAGKRKMAVNLLLTEPQNIASLPVVKFDGAITFTDLPSDIRCVAGYRF